MKLWFLLHCFKIYEDQLMTTMLTIGELVLHYHSISELTLLLEFHESSSPSEYQPSRWHLLVVCVRYARNESSLAAAATWLQTLKNCPKLLDIDRGGDVNRIQAYYNCNCIDAYY